AITMAALIYYEELPGERDVRKVCIIGILVSLAILTRTAGIALLVAFLFWQAVGTKNNRSLLAVALAVVPYLIWEVIKARIYVGPWTYTSLLAEAYPLNDIPGLIHKLAIDANNMWIGWRQYIDIGMEPSSLPAALLLAVLALPVWFARLIERRLDAVYLLLYAGMILIWPFPDHTARFLYPVMPMLFFYCILTLQKYAKLQWRNTAVGTLLALIFLGAAPSSGQILGKAFAKNSDMLGNFGKSRMLYGRQSPMTVIDRNAWLVGQLTHAMQESAQLVPPGACVYTMHYEWYMYYARRYARPVTGYDLERLNKGGKLDCPYMFINWSNTHSHVRPGYPAQDLNRRYRVLHQYRTVHPQIGRGRDPILAELVQFVPDQP
ncbi:MAG: hypothetical protein HY255_03835, partial [Betaproteobacteria bacterium]|nr:hypothetical protein [Betaproteobacteria bacterium]